MTLNDFLKKYKVQQMKTTVKIVNESNDNTSVNDVERACLMADENNGENTVYDLLTKDNQLLSNDGMEANCLTREQANKFIANMKD